jgi:hypothetical protein
VARIHEEKENYIRRRREGAECWQGRMLLKVNETLPISGRKETNVKDIGKIGALT